MIARPGHPAGTGDAEHVAQPELTAEQVLDTLRREKADAEARLAATAEILQSVKTSRGDAQPVFEAVVRSATELSRANFCIL